MTPDIDSLLPISTTLEVRDRCLCLHAQRAARAVARAFDDAFRPHKITSGQFSILMSLNRPDPPRISDLVPLLGMDRTTLTAALKPLAARGLVDIAQDPQDRRNRRLSLTDAGRSVLKAALPDWRRTQAALEARLDRLAPDDLRGALDEIAARPAP